MTAFPPSLAQLAAVLTLFSVAYWGSVVLFERYGVGPTQSGPAVEGVDDWS
jgi:hypothetical protein